MGAKARIICLIIFAVTLGMGGGVVLANPDFEWKIIDVEIDQSDDTEDEDTNDNSDPQVEGENKDEDKDSTVGLDQNEITSGLKIRDSVMVYDEGGNLLNVELVGYEIIKDAIDPSKEGIVFFFNRENLTEEIVILTGDNDSNFVINEDDIELETSVIYQNQVLNRVTASTPDDERITYPNYINAESCDNYTSLLPQQTLLCYQIYPYEGEGQYAITQQTEVEGDAQKTFVVNSPYDVKLVTSESDKYSEEESIYSFSNYPRSKFENTPYLNEKEPVQIIEDGVEIGTVAFNRYEIMQSPITGRKGVVFFFDETNTGTKPLELGMYQPNILTSTHVFYEDIYLDPMNHEEPDWRAIEYPEYDDTNICLAVEVLEPGESRTCYQYYSYVDDGDYLINIATQLESTSLEFKGYKSYLINVKE